LKIKEKNWEIMGNKNITFLNLKLKLLLKKEC
jgi:hypothetical protein